MRVKLCISTLITTQTQPGGNLMYGLSFLYIIFIYSFLLFQLVDSMLSFIIEARYLVGMALMHV